MKLFLIIKLRIIQRYKICVQRLFDLSRKSEMILTGKEIYHEVIAKRITIEPFDRENLNPNSYNYHLGNIVKISSNNLIDAAKEQEWISFEIPYEGIVLEPYRLYLGHTLENIGSKEYVTSLIGRSSVGRLGLYLQLSADLGQLGAIHSW